MGVLALEALSSSGFHTSFPQAMLFIPLYHSLIIVYIFNSNL